MTIGNLGIYYSMDKLTTKTIPNLQTRWTEIYLYQSEGVTYEDMDAVRRGII